VVGAAAETFSKSRPSRAIRSKAGVEIAFAP
jgi:hypothetical protein